MYFENIGDVPPLLADDWRLATRDWNLFILVVDDLAIRSVLEQAIFYGCPDQSVFLHTVEADYPRYSCISYVVTAANDFDWSHFAKIFNHELQALNRIDHPTAMAYIDQNHRGIEVTKQVFIDSDLRQISQQIAPRINFRYNPDLRWESTQERLHLTWQAPIPSTESSFLNPSKLVLLPIAVGIAALLLLPRSPA